MKHVKPLAIKFALVLAVLFIILSLFFGYSFWTTVIMSGVIAVTSYFVGDVVILPISNNSIATIVDVLLAFHILWLLSPFIMETGIPVYVAAISSVVLGAGEWFFHKYMRRTIIDDVRTGS